MTGGQIVFPSTCDLWSLYLLAASERALWLDSAFLDHRQEILLRFSAQSEGKGSASNMMRFRKALVITKTCLNHVPSGDPWEPISPWGSDPSGLPPTGIIVETRTRGGCYPIVTPRLPGSLGTHRIFGQGIPNRFMVLLGHPWTSMEISLNSMEVNQIP